MITKYFIRLDDACPTMDRAKWNAVFTILEKWCVKVLIGVIPDNHDTSTMPCAPDSHFWDLMQDLESKGHIIALHGYDHCYQTNCGGINPVHNRSEFAGLPYTEQAKKLTDGYAMLRKYGLNPKVFFAPSHTFDKTTIKALKKTTPIRFISDTIDFRPYRYEGITMLPQQMGRCRQVSIPGYWTFCLHPNGMTPKDIMDLDLFIQSNHQHIMNYDELIITKPANRKSLLGKLLNLVFSVKRYIA